MPLHKIRRNIANCYCRCHVEGVGNCDTCRDRYHKGSWS